LSKNYNVISYWFKLYQKTVDNYDIQLKDTYNTNEKGAAIGVIRKQCCIVLKSEKRPKLL
jgi:hypothetical protein